MLTFSKIHVNIVEVAVIIISVSLISLLPSFSAAIPINIWPKPRILSWPKPEASLLSPKFAIHSPKHRYLSTSVTRYHRLIQSENYQPIVATTPSYVKLIKGYTLHSLTINVTDLSVPLHHGVNESYSLLIPKGGFYAHLTAQTVWGAMRGLETFSQMVWGKGRLYVPVGILVWDSPLFAHRGLMLDTSRNYYGVEDIMRTIEAMSANKLNVFHWHITDSQSFPLVLPSEPSLAAKGSYGPDMVYTPEDVRKIVQFGFEHGVRVLPEIDTPAHTGSWAEAYPEIMTCANMFWWPAESSWEERLASQPGTGQLNPLNPKTYEVVKNVIRDLTTQFPEPFFHAGADEIIPGCWKTDPAIQSFLSNGGTLSQLLEKYINSTLPYIVSRNRVAIYWEDVLLDAKIKVDSSRLPRENTILQTWNNGPDNIKRIVSAGYRVIVSSSEFYYLDCGHGGYLGNDSQYDQQDGGGNSGNGGSWCAPFKTWQTIYNYDITDGLLGEEAKLVLGGEVALWSEQADPTVLDARLWPRACALAESMWSGNRDERGVKRYAEAVDRLNQWRFRMVNRGFGAEPIQPLWCLKNPGMCNTVHNEFTTSKNEPHGGTKKRAAYSFLV
ncbi:PREDICTED: beta-hexosaminidase 2 [Tarenaya hassleriana]|uniref:beta-hexosaminidase 2 n=1 Tax=Tarenaya hassleriana TaxID=28532 RepID=UPI00053C8178|nr:PREDICTED: beta-hexosaminidase 2 [Tarenaya hassleriana]